MSAKNVISDRTAALLEKQRELDERIKRSMQRDRSISRKSRNRALLLIGVAVEKKVKSHPNYLATVRSFVLGLKENEQEAVSAFLDTLLTGDLSPTSASPGAKPSITSPALPQKSEAVDP